MTKKRRDYSPKTRTSFDPPLNAMKDRHELASIWSALDGDTRSVLTRLKVGIATTLEQQVAGLVFDSEYKPSRRGASSRQRLFEIAQTVAFRKKMRPTARRKPVISHVAEHFGKNASHIYEALKAFDDNALSEIERILKAKINTRNPATTPPQLRMVEKKRNGHIVREFHGEPRDWMNALAGATQLRGTGTFLHLKDDDCARPAPTNG